MPHTAILGFGSPFGDDRAGWLVVRELRGRIATLCDDVVLGELATPLDLVQVDLPGIDRWVLIDACRGAGPPGSLHHWRWPTDDWQACAGGSTHGWGLSEALQLAQSLGRLPAVVEIWGIEIAGSESASRLPGEPVPPDGPVSPAMQAAVDRLVVLLTEEFAPTAGATFPPVVPLEMDRRHA